MESESPNGQELTAEANACMGSHRANRKLHQAGNHRVDCSLLLPIRSMYATDSDSMLTKAKAMLEAVEEREVFQGAGKRCYRKEAPSGNHGDCNVIGTCGELHGTPSLSGHLETNTQERYKAMLPKKISDKGEATPKTSTAHIRATSLPTKSFEPINGTGLVRPGRWLAARHGNYTRSCDAPTT